MGYGATANAIQDGTIVGMNIPAGRPGQRDNAGIRDQLGKIITLLEFSDADLAMP